MSNLRVRLHVLQSATQSVRPNGLYIPPSSRISTPLPATDTQPTLIITKTPITYDPLAGYTNATPRAPAHHDGIHTRENGANGRPFQSAAAGRPKRLRLAVAWDRRAPGRVNARCRSGVLVSMGGEGGDLIRGFIDQWMAVCGGVPGQ